MIHNNSTDIQPYFHSTDSHGTNPVNFALLHVFSRQFAPRYKDLCDKVRTSLTGFNHPRSYGDAILKPVRKIREDDIIREWDECRRIFVSLAMKETTQMTCPDYLGRFRRQRVIRDRLLLRERLRETTPANSANEFAVPRRNTRESSLDSKSPTQQFLRLGGDLYFSLTSQAVNTRHAL